LQLIRQVTRHRDRLIELEPVREFFNPNLAAGHDPGAEATRLAIGKNLRRDRTIKGPGADTLAGQPLGTVKAKAALELSQFKLGVADFQARLVGVEIHQDFRLNAFLQRDIQIDTAFERAVSLPAGERFSGANRRLLKYFQAITQPALKIAVQKQVADLAGGHMGNTDGHIADLGIEQLALAGHDAHTAVFDEHITRDVAHMGPAGLERQFGAMHFKEQADIARCRNGVVAQRALVLEEALFHRTLYDCGAQPFGERRAQHFWQIFRRESAVAIRKTDPQVHVVFLGMVEVDTDQKVRRNLAFFAQHFDVRGNQGEAVLVQRPRQQGVGLLILPGFGEDRLQMQHEVLAVEPQFALAQVTADQAADIARSRGAVGGVEADLLQVRRKAEFLIIAGLGAVIGQHIAQRTRDLELVNNLGHTVRPGCQGVEQGCDRGQVQAVGL